MHRMRIQMLVSLLWHLLPYYLLKWWGQDNTADFNDKLDEQHSHPLHPTPIATMYLTLQLLKVSWYITWYTLLITCLGEVEDVVAQHHQHNHPPRLLNNLQLEIIRDQQTSQCSHSVSHNNDPEVPPSVHPQSLATHAAASPNPQPPPAIAPTTSGTYPDNTDPSHLQFYPPAVWDIIKCAKQFSHCNLVSIHSFLLHSQFNPKAVEYINEAIAKCCAHSLTVLEGKYLSNDKCMIWNSLLPLPGWWPQHTSGITKLICIMTDLCTYLTSISSFGKILAIGDHLLKKKHRAMFIRAMTGIYKTTVLSMLVLQEHS